MRRVLYALLAAGLAVSATACDSFLTPDPATFSSSNNYYQTPQQMEQAVNGLYADLRGLFGGDFRDMGDLRGETVTLQFNINVPGFTFQIDEFSEATADGDVDGEYSSVFSAIFDSNVILSRIDGVEFANEAEKARITAEAKYIRSLAYWMAIQYWGLGEGWSPDNLAIPLILEEVTSPSAAFDLQRATVQEVWNQIVTDLTAAAPDLPEKGSPESDAGRITRGAAEFLLGATYQMDPSKQAEALAEFQKLAGEGYSLVTTGTPASDNNAYREVFDPANKNNSESILEIQFTVTSENGALNQNLSGGMAPLNAAGGGTNGDPNFTAVYGTSGGGDYTPTQNFILSFAGADPADPVAPFDLRYTGGYGEFCPNTDGNNTGAADVSGVLGVPDVLRPGDDPTLSGPNHLFPEVNIASVRDPQTHVVRNDCIPYFTKWRWPDHMPLQGRDDNNWIIFRYADALLRIAESAVRLGDQPTALAAINQVRARAGLPDLTTVTLDDVLQERAWELTGEGWRWFDLKRFGVAVETIQHHGDVRRALIPRQAAQTDIYMATGDTYRLRYPIRPRDVELSQCKILQNPGWGGCEGA